MAMLLIQSNTPGLLHINGQFCGRVDESPHTYLTRTDDRGYLSFQPFSDDMTPLAREICIQQDQLLAPDSGLYALQWPEGVCQIEIRPASYAHSTATESSIPPQAQDLVKRPAPNGNTLCTYRTASGMCAALYDTHEHRIDMLCAKRLTWDTPEILQALEEAGDFVGHASLCTYRLTGEGFHPLTRQSVWAVGAPRWPSTPLQTLRAYLEALRIGADAEAAQYLSASDRHSALSPFDRVVDLRFALTHAPEHLPQALGILSVVSPTLARVQAVCARTRSIPHAQGAHKIEELCLVP